MNSRLEVQAGFLRPIYLVLLRISEPPQEASWCRVKNLACSSTGSVLILSRGYYQLAFCSVMDSVDTEIVRVSIAYLAD